VDRDGTSVASIFISDDLGKASVSLNDELVKSGLARWRRSEDPYDDQLLRSERDARSEERGIWATANQVTSPD
jgi:endonuclease YncB( thermonuclease family)